MHGIRILQDQLANKGNAMKPLKISGQALLLAAVSSVPFAAHAQTPPDAEAVEQEEENRIVVTGSRIARDPNIGSPAPILSLDAEALTQAGTSDVVDVLRDIPALSTSTTSEGSIDGIFSESVGQSILNLRGLGREQNAGSGQWPPPCLWCCGRASGGYQFDPDCFDRTRRNTDRRRIVAIRCGRCNRRCQLCAQG